jgi:hypothetical protein
VQRYSARQAVAPNRDCLVVSGDAQRGHGTVGADLTRMSGTGPLDRTGAA